MNTANTNGPMNGDHRSWVVVLESATGIDDRSLERVLQVLADAQAVALQCLERFAIQMEVAAGGQAEALFVALARWRSALARVGQPPTEVARAEVLCREEFERDCRHAYGEAVMPQVEASEHRLRLLSS